MGTTSSAASGGLGQVSDEKLRADVAVRLHTKRKKDRAAAEKDNRPLKKGRKPMPTAKRPDANADRKALADAFRAVDRNKDGSVEFPEFKKVANAAGVKTSDARLRVVFSRFDKNHNGKVDMTEFMDFMCPLGGLQVQGVGIGTGPKSSAGRSQAEEVTVSSPKSPAKKPASMKTTTELPSSPLAGDVLTKVARAVYERELSLQQAFQRWDLDGSGALDPRELAHALNELGLGLGAEGAKAIFAAFDVDGDGRLSCHEVIQGLSAVGPEKPASPQSKQPEQDSPIGQSSPAASPAEDTFKPPLRTPRSQEAIGQQLDTQLHSETPTAPSALSPDSLREQAECQQQDTPLHQTSLQPTSPHVLESAPSSPLAAWTEDNSPGKSKQTVREASKQLPSFLEAAAGFSNLSAGLSRFAAAPDARRRREHSLQSDLATDVCDMVGRSAGDAGVHATPTSEAWRAAAPELVLAGPPEDSAPVMMPVTSPGGLSRPEEAASQMMTQSEELRLSESQQLRKQTPSDAGKHEALPPQPSEKVMHDALPKDGVPEASQRHDGGGEAKPEHATSHAAEERGAKQDTQQQESQDTQQQQQQCQTDEQQQVECKPEATPAGEVLEVPQQPQQQPQSQSTQQQSQQKQEEPERQREEQPEQQSDRQQSQQKPEQHQPPPEPKQQAQKQSQQQQQQQPEQQKEQTQPEQHQPPAEPKQQAQKQSQQQPEQQKQQTQPEQQQAPPELKQQAQKQSQQPEQQKQQKQQTQPEQQQAPPEPKQQAQKQSQQQPQQQKQPEQQRPAPETNQQAQQHSEQPQQHSEQQKQQQSQQQSQQHSEQQKHQPEHQKPPTEPKQQAQQNQSQQQKQQHLQQESKQPPQRNQNSTQQPQQQSKQQPHPSQQQPRQPKNPQQQEPKQQPVARQDHGEQPASMQLDAKQASEAKHQQSQPSKHTQQPNRVEQQPLTKPQAAPHETQRQPQKPKAQEAEQVTARPQHNKEKQQQQGAGRTNQKQHTTADESTSQGKDQQPQQVHTPPVRAKQPESPNKEASHRTDQAWHAEQLQQPSQKVPTQQAAKHCVPTSRTDLAEIAAYAWKVGPIPDSASDEDVFARLRKRLKGVRATAAEALAQCMGLPDVATATAHSNLPPVTVEVFVAFARQLRYTLSASRAQKLLGSSGEMSVHSFLALLGSQGLDRKQSAALAGAASNAQSSQQTKTTAAATAPADKQPPHPISRGASQTVIQHATLVKQPAAALGQPSPANVSPDRRTARMMQRVAALSSREKEVISLLRRSLLQRSISLEAQVSARTAHAAATAAVPVELEAAEFLAVLETVGLAVVGDETTPRAPPGATPLSEDEAAELLLALGFGAGGKPGKVNCADFLELLRSAKMSALDAAEPPPALLQGMKDNAPPAGSFTSKRIAIAHGRPDGRGSPEGNDGRRRWLPETYKGQPDESSRFLRAAAGVLTAETGRAICRDEAGTVKKAFHDWDANGDGHISKPELLAVLHRLDSRFTPDSVTRMFSAVDKNRDGLIDYREFTSWLFC